MDYATKLLTDEEQNLMQAHDNLIATKERILEMMKNSETFKDEDGLINDYIQDFDKTEANLIAMIVSIRSVLELIRNSVDKGGGDI